MRGKQGRIFFREQVKFEIGAAKMKTEVITATDAKAQPTLRLFQNNFLTGWLCGGAFFLAYEFCLGHGLFR